MKPLIYAKPKPHSKIYEEDRLRKSIKGSLEAIKLEYTTSVFDDYDLVHFINIHNTSKVKLAKESKLPIIINALYCENIHKSAIVQFKKDELKLKGKYRRCLNLADVVLVPGDEAKKFLISEKVTSKIIVFKPPVNLKHFKMQDEADRNLFFRYFTEREGVQYVLSIGDYDNEIEMKNLIDVAHLCQNIKFYFFGANYSLWSNKELDDIPSNVVLSDLVESDVFRSALMNSQVLLVLDPKKKEAINVVEAMAAKVQVMSFNDPHDESYLKNGENAYLCNGAYDLAKCLESYLKGKLKPTIEQAYKLACEHDLENSGKRLLKIYESLAK